MGHRVKAEYTCKHVVCGVICITSHLCVSNTSLWWLEIILYFFKYLEIILLYTVFNKNKYIIGIMM